MPVLNYDEQFDMALNEQKRQQPSPEQDFYSEMRSLKELNGVQSWLNKLPKNIAKGGYLAALETVNTVDSVLAEAEKIPSISANSPEPGEEAPAAPAEPKTPPLHESFPEVFDALNKFGEEMQEGNTTADSITQAFAQFALPFAGYARLLGGLSKGGMAVKAARAGAAEMAAVSTSFAPDEARIAEMISEGRQMNNKFGSLLQIVAPDGSLLARYLDWMGANRESESDLMARFKNGVDSVAVTAAGAALLKAAGVTLRAGKLALAEGGAAAGTPARQRGMVTFHGSPHPRVASNNIEDLFSLKNIGTGEGNQAFGYGIYFAEHPQVAKNYVSPGDSRFARVTNQMEPMTEFAYDFMEQGLSDIQVMEKMIQKYGARVEFDDVSKALKQARKLRGRGGVFEVDIPDETIGRFLDRDAQFDAQPENVKRAIAKAQDEFGVRQVTILNDEGQLAPTGFFDAANGSGSVFYKALSKVTGSDEAASRWLAENGVPGLQFADAQSRTFTGQGGFIKPAVEALKGKKPTRNFVLFDPQEIKSVKQGEETLFTKGTK